MKRLLATLTLPLALGLGVTSHAAVTGQWDFNNSNLVATVGTDLADFGTTPTTFTTATIGGNTAIVMNFPACDPTQGYVMTHGIAPNGGGAYVNQYTLIMDIMYPAASSSQWRGLFQTSTANANDGDLFVNTGNGIGIATIYHGAILADTWHRVAFVFDMTQTTNMLKKYIDGFLVGSQNLDALDGRWAMDPTALLFTDEDNETKGGFVNSLQIHDVPLTDTDIFAIGTPTAAGIPGTIPVFTNLVVTVTPTSATSIVGMNANPFTAQAVGTGTITYQWYRNGALLSGKTNATLRIANLQVSDAGAYTVVANNGIQSATNSPAAVLTVNGTPPAFVTGQWDFNSGNLNASCGQALQYLDPQVAADTSFGTTTSFGISDIAGTPANVMYWTNSIDINGFSTNGFIMTHGIAPNGGGAFVNQYTLIIDLLYPTASSGFYRSLWQTGIGNANDGDTFINPGDGLGTMGVYHGLLSPDVWHRVALAFDLTGSELSKYIDGTNVMSELGVTTLHDAQSIGGLDGRWALDPTALLFADEDGEVQPVFVSSIQIRNGRMTDASIAAMGAPTANKIPGCIHASKSGGSVVIDWTGNVLESAPSVSGPWTVVSGAAHPHTVASPTGTQFFRAVR